MNFFPLPVSERCPHTCYHHCIHREKCLPFQDEVLNERKRQQLQVWLIFAVNSLHSGMQICTVTFSPSPISLYGVMVMLSHLAVSPLSSITLLLVVFVGWWPSGFTAISNGRLSRECGWVHVRYSVVLFSSVWETLVTGPK